MFELFKKKSEAPAETIENVVVSEYNSNYPEVVQQIHREFMSAADRLLADANAVIADASTKDVEKVSRLEKLGFKQVQQVADIKPLMQKAELSKEQIELVNYYKREYPLNKFIVESQVKEICYKYNLVCGDVGRYKGFVPEKNLREIEKFKIKNNDAIIAEVVAIFFDSTRKPLGGMSKDELTRDAWGIERGGSATFGRGGIVRDHFSKRIQDFFNDDSIQYLRVKGFVGGDKLQICAPVKDMDIKGLELADGYKLQKIHVPDPVVLQPVKGGYLILTVWGDEASDPIVTNEINN